MLKKILVPALSGIALSGCVTEPTVYPTNFMPATVAQGTAVKAFDQKANTLFVVLDSSSSTNDAYQASATGATKFNSEKEMLYRLNRTIPTNISLSSGLETFGFGHCIHVTTSVKQPVAPHSTAAFQSALEQAACASGGTPMDSALNTASVELDSAPGNIALLVVSDGHQFPPNTLATAEALEAKFGERLCIYSVWVGNAPETQGKLVLQQFSNIAQCGYSVNATDIATPTAMATFVESMLFNSRAMVAPAPVAVIRGPQDSDGDGVIDARDECPNTPAGAKVNSRGCWSYNSSVSFDFDSARIKSGYAELFNNAADVLRRSPSMTVNLVGHTDSVGAASYNMGLGQRRADAVKAHLVSQGIDSSRMSTASMGEENPIAGNDTAEGRAENRRVGFTITSR
ncbi:MAG: OmpA family protein [Methyloprofundus sp.]|nr:OmpA family protein [Methyloprofundus sp.]